MLHAGHMADLRTVAPVPEAVDASGLLALADAHHARAVRPLGTHEVAAHLVKAYGIEAPGREVEGVEAGLAVAKAHLAGAGVRGSLGLAVLVVHAGGDGDYVLVHTWIEGYMSDLAVFVGPVERPDELRPGRQGLAPCVWEAAVLAYERDAFVRHVLDGDGEFAGRLDGWAADVLEGEVR